MKVVSSADSSDNLICQKPEFASNLEKTFAPPSWAKVCSTDGRMWLSHCTLNQSWVTHLVVEKTAVYQTLAYVFCGPVQCI